jgi:hypothetical protein
VPTLHACNAGALRLATAQRTITTTISCDVQALEAVIQNATRAGLAALGAPATVTVTARYAPELKPYRQVTAPLEASWACTQVAVQTALLETV